MSEIDSFLSDIRIYVAAPKDQRAWNRTATRDRMKYLKQEDLIEALTRMNLQELQYCMGCGIPGTANTEAIKLVRIRREEFNKFLERQSKKRVELNEKGSLELENQATISVNENNEWSNENESESKGSSLSKALLAFKEGRESDL